MKTFTETATDLLLVVLLSAVCGGAAGFFVARQQRPSMFEDAFQRTVLEDAMEQVKRAREKVEKQNLGKRGKDGPD